MIKTVRRLAIALTILAAAPVSAQPGAEDDEEVPQVRDVVIVTPAPVVISGASQNYPTPLAQPATTAPQNQPWSNVSHINGNPVPVGEQGNYLYKWKKTNVATNPIGWMIGFYGISVSHAVSDNVAIRGDVNLIDIRDSNSKGYELGASAPIYFKRVFQGPFIEPGIIVRDIDDKNEDEFSSGTSSDPASVGPSVVFGWHWTFDSGLNIAAAFGIMRNLNKRDSMDEFDSDSDIEPSGYFRIGYAF